MSDTEIQATFLFPFFLLLCSPPTTTILQDISFRFCLCSFIISNNNNIANYRKISIDSHSNLNSIPSSRLLTNRTGKCRQGSILLLVAGGAKRGVREKTCFATLEPHEICPCFFLLQQLFCACIFAGKTKKQETKYIYTQHRRENYRPAPTPRHLFSFSYHDGRLPFTSSPTMSYRISFKDYSF